MTRKPFPEGVETAVLTKCKRRCALCFGLNNDVAEKRGQLAHIDAPENNDESNAAFLFTLHHDLYDTTSSQTKGYTPGELRAHQETLWAYVSTIKKRMKREPSAQRALKSRRGAGVALDVYDRRLSVYRTARQFVRDVSEKLSPELRLILKFATDTDEALFLYDESVAEYLETLFKKALRLHTLELLRERMGRDPDEAQKFQLLLNEETALAHWFAEQPEEIRARFAPFLRLA
jgi:hypothetical protein